MTNKDFDFVSLLNLETKILTEKEVRNMTDDQLDSLLVGIELSTEEELIVQREFKRRKTLKD